MGFVHWSWLRFFAIDFALNGGILFQDFTGIFGGRAYCSEGEGGAEGGLAYDYAGASGVGYDFVGEGDIDIFAG